MFPPAIRIELPAIHLLFAEVSGAGAGIAALRDEVSARARATLVADQLANHPAAGGIRRFMRQTGCDPTRYRPSSEALVRRLLKGEPLPAIAPTVDLSNCLSVELLVPSCVVDAERLRPPLVLRAGRAGESLDTARGPLSLAEKPVLADEDGPFGTPMTDAARVRLTPATLAVWLYVYLPEAVTGDAATAALRRLAAAAGLEVGGVAVV